MLLVYLSGIGNVADYTYFHPVLPQYDFKLEIAQNTMFLPFNINDLTFTISKIHSINFIPLHSGISFAIHEIEILDDIYIK